MKKSILFLILIFMCINTFAQLNNAMLKYWYYRDRLQYFVTPGTKIGESQIICVRNCFASGNDVIDDGSFKNVDYGQHGKYTGLYISTLATEYYLLQENGQYADANKTYDELLLSLEAFKKYWDEKAETLLT